VSQSRRQEEFTGLLRSIAAERKRGSDGTGVKIDVLKPNFSVKRLSTMKGDWQSLLQLALITERRLFKDGDATPPCSFSLGRIRYTGSRDAATDPGVRREDSLLKNHQSYMAL